MKKNGAPQARPKGKKWRAPQARAIFRRKKGPKGPLFTENTPKFSKNFENFQGLFLGKNLYFLLYVSFVFYFNFILMFIFPFFLR